MLGRSLAWRTLLGGTPLIAGAFLHHPERDAPEEAANSICFVYLLQGSTSGLLHLQPLTNGNSSGQHPPPATDPKPADFEDFIIFLSTKKKKKQLLSFQA